MQQRDSISSAMNEPTRNSQDVPTRAPLPPRTPLLRSRTEPSPKKDVVLRSSGISHSTLGPTLSMSLSNASMLTPGCVNADDAYTHVQHEDVLPHWLDLDTTQGSSCTASRRGDDAPRGILSYPLQPRPSVDRSNTHYAPRAVGDDGDARAEEDEHRCRIHEAAHFFRAFRPANENSPTAHKCDINTSTTPYCATAIDIDAAESEREEWMRERLEPSESRDPRRYSAIEATLNSFLVVVADSSTSADNAVIHL